MNDYSTISRLLEEGTFQDLSPQIRTALFIGGMAFLSSLLVTMTAFTRIVIVLSFTRRALATQEIPPTPVIIGLSLFLTFFVMGPTVQNVEERALVPYLNEDITGLEAWQRATGELRTFMLRQTRKKDLQLFIDMSQEARPSVPEETPLRILIPAFVISELKT